MNPFKLIDNIVALFGVIGVATVSYLCLAYFRGGITINDTKYCWSCKK